MLEHINRLKAFHALELPENIGCNIHQNRLLKMAREGGQMTPKNLGKFESERCYATLVALALEGTASVTDEIIDLHDHILMKLFSIAKNKHQQQFQKQGKEINNKVRLYSKIGHVLLEAKQSGRNPYAAIEAIIPWEDFTQSVTEADQLAQPKSFDHLYLISEQFNTLRRYTPEFMDVLKLRAAPAAQGVLNAMIGGALNIKHVRAHWDDILRLATSIKQGTVTASLMLRKLGSYPRQNGLAVALRELGRIERTLFILDWIQNVELRRRVHAGLNKGEARNALARAVHFNRLGEIRDRSFEQQRYRANGLNLVTAAIVLWNTVYLERATQTLRETGKPIDDTMLQYLSPLGWEHINLTGDYVWRQSKRVEQGEFQPLRMIGD